MSGSASVSGGESIAEHSSSISSDLSNSEYCDYSNSVDCSSLEGSVSLPKRLITSTPNEPESIKTTSPLQRSIILECDTIWCSEYSKDIFAYLRSIESTRKIITYKSPQIQHRATLIDLIKRIAQTERLCRTTIHLAVYMLDVFMDTYKIVLNKLNLVALICVLIASKVEERDQNVPKICNLNSYIDDKYGRGDFKALERMFLNFFKWALMVPTSATFLESFAYRSVTWDEIRNSLPWQGIISSSRTSDKRIVPEFSRTCNNVVFEFLELTLTERRLVHARPSLISAACIGAARKVYQITPLWPKRLQILTEYTYDRIEEYVECLISLREFSKRKNVEAIKETPESGYLTESDSDSVDDDDDDEEYTDCPLPLKRQRLTY